jgi:hypothetical protein
MPWYKRNGGYFSWHDLLLLSSIRETGAVAAALLISAHTFGILGASMFAAGVWVIMFTLIVEPTIMRLVLISTER